MTSEQERYKLIEELAHLRVELKILKTEVAKQENPLTPEEEAKIEKAVDLFLGNLYCKYAQPKDT